MYWEVLIFNTLLFPGGAPGSRDTNQYLRRDAEGKKRRGWRCRLLFLPGSQGGPEVAELWTQGHLFGERKSWLLLCVTFSKQMRYSFTTDLFTWARLRAKCFTAPFIVGRLSLKRPVWCDRCPTNTWCCCTEFVSTIRTVSRCRGLCIHLVRGTTRTCVWQNGVLCVEQISWLRSLSN